MLRTYVQVCVTYVVWFTEIRFLNLQTIALSTPTPIPTTPVPPPSAGESALRVALQTLFPNSTPHFNYKSIPGLVHPTSGAAMELDVYFSDMKLAFEYQGGHHFQENFQGNFEKQRQRDAHKREMCQTHGITLVIVPYWWKGSVHNLAATVLQLRPDLRDAVHFIP